MVTGSLSLGCVKIDQKLSDIRRQDYKIKLEIHFNWPAVPYDLFQSFFRST